MYDSLTIIRLSFETTEGNLDLKYHLSQQMIYHIPAPGITEAAGSPFSHLDYSTMSTTSSAWTGQLMAKIQYSTQKIWYLSDHASNSCSHQ